ncbi:MAG: tRNA guanosine(34) transglycosylase Tgt [Thermoanaerobaculia bacterium]
MENSDRFFRIFAVDGAARRGRLALSKGVVETPAFMPVGTLGAVKGVPFDRLEEWDCRLILANTYHLMLRPGMEGVRRAGGLHAFIGWNRALLTDSGGFQVLSLEKNRKIREEGVEFRSHLDGTPHFLTPELAMELQSTFGTDIAMCLDVCPGQPSGDRELEDAVSRTIRWADRCRQSWRGPGALFGILQGGSREDLRRQCAEAIVPMGLPGYAVGGVAVGESKAEISDATEMSCAFLPAEKPRYLMGVGTPADLLRAVRQGIDLFDCVLPTRNGRMGHAFTSRGGLTIKHARFSSDFQPLDPDCRCPVCVRHSRAYLRHLFVLKDLSAPVLISLHNVFFYLAWMGRIREAIEAGRLGSLAAPPESKVDEEEP